MKIEELKKLKNSAPSPALPQGKGVKKPCERFWDFLLVQPSQWLNKKVNDEK